MAQRIHLFGACGSGVSTLGQGLADAMGVPWLESDDFYWEPTFQPFTVKRPIPQRHALLLPLLEQTEGWVLSGSMVSWCEPYLPLFHAAIYLHCPTEQRIARLWARERARYGTRIDPGGDREFLTKEFIEWAEGYDSGELPGRSGPRHQEWIRTLPFPVARLDSSVPREELLAKSLDWLRSLA